MHRHVFGPVPSRRLGRSLGVDLVPFKTCCYDCVFCQLGRTTCQTVQRREWVDVDAVLAEVAARLAEGAQPDWITLSGSGEPTLHSGLGRVLRGIRERSDVPVAVLTHGGLLGDPGVQADLATADLVVPSLDGGDPSTFQALNRPHPDLSFEAVTEGLVSFRRSFRGRLWLEVMLVRGVNDTPEAVQAIARIARRVAPDRIQVNTVVRPPADPGTLRVEDAVLEELLPLLGPDAEIIVPPAPFRPGTPGASIDADVVELLRRRPCTAPDVAAGLGLHPVEVGKHLAPLLSAGYVEAIPGPGEPFYRARPIPANLGGLVPSPGALELDLAGRCIETAARAARRALVEALVAPGPLDPRLPPALELLDAFLAKTDFPALRTADPDLAGGREGSVTLRQGSDGSVTWSKGPGPGPEPR